MNAKSKIFVIIFIRKYIHSKQIKSIYSFLTNTQKIVFILVFLFITQILDIFIGHIITFYYTL